MKFLHTADLHLGKRLNDISFLEDQKQVLSQIVDIAKAEAVDAVLIAGDVYQKASPQSEAMAVFGGFVTALRAAGAEVFGISGNHDSAQRISYFSELLKRSGVYFSEEFDGHLQQFRREDAFGGVTVSLLPFLRPAQVRRFFPDEKIDTAQEAVEAVLRHSDLDLSRRNLLIAHQFITGAEQSDSEEMSVGGLDSIDARVFDAFDYVAMGHIHKPQRCLRDTVRYAGSILKYSLSEVNHRKSVTVVDVREKGTVEIRTVPLVAPREMRVVEGMMADVMRMPYSEDCVWVTIHDELPPPDARVALTTVFPNMMRFSVVNSKTRLDMDVSARETLYRKSITELFSDFYRLQNNDVAPSERHRAMLERVLREMEADAE